MVREISVRQESETVVEVLWAERHGDGVACDVGLEMGDWLVCILIEGLRESELLTPSGRKWPHTVAPPRGTIRRSPPDTGLQIRKPSLMTAFRKGSCWSALNVISSSLSKIVRTSVSSFLSSCGFCTRQLRIPQMVVPVVSLPPRSKRAVVDSISGMLILEKSGLFFGSSMTVMKSPSADSGRSSRRWIFSAA